MSNNWKKAFATASALVMALGSTGCAIPGLGGGPKNEAPVITVAASAVVAQAGDVIVAPTATVKDEDATLTTATVALYQGENKVADVDGSISALEVGEYTLKYTATDSEGLATESNVAVSVVENVLNVDLTASVQAGGATEIHLGSAAIKAAGAEAGTFDLADYDYIRSDISNKSAESVLFYTKINTAAGVVDVDDVANSQYSALTIKENSTRTLRFTNEYLINNTGNAMEDISSVVYYVKNDGEAARDISFRINDFVLGELDTVDSMTFRENENADKMVNLSNLKALVDFNGATALDYVGQTKVKGGGEMVSEVEDGMLKAGAIEGEENQSTFQWQFYSYLTDQGIAKQSLLKRDLSDVEWLVMVFEKDEEISYGNSQICLYLQSEGWGVSYDLPCIYQGLANMWYSGIKNQDGVNQYLVYYAIPIKQCIEDEKIQVDWCANVDTLILQMASCPVEETTTIKVHGIYWC